MLMQQQQQENLYSPMMSRSPTLPSSSSWHPIHASPSEDMWELPASSSSMSDDRDDFPTSGLHQEFSFYHEDYSTSNNHEQERTTPMPPTVTVRANHHQHNDPHRESSPRLSNDDNRNSRNNGIGLSETKCVLGDATNTTLRRKNNTSNTSRRIQRSFLN